MSLLVCCRRSRLQFAPTINVVFNTKSLHTFHQTIRNSIWCNGNKKYKLFVFGVLFHRDEDPDDLPGVGDGSTRCGARL